MYRIPAATEPKAALLRVGQASHPLKKCKKKEKEDATYRKKQIRTVYICLAPVEGPYTHPISKAQCAYVPSTIRLL